jgi:hypothetical protein
MGERIEVRGRVLAKDSLSKTQRINRRFGLNGNLPRQYSISA